MNAFFEAVRFLTLIPVPFLPPMRMDNYERSIARAMAWFPVVGLLIGAIGAGAGWLGDYGWGPLVRSAFIVIAWGIVTSGLHLDGLSDTFDAVMSWRPRERKLEIMKDSRIGAMGAIALVAVLLLKVALLHSADAAAWLPAALLAPVLGRWADLYGVFFFPAAVEGGLGRHFKDHIRRRDFIFATVQMIVIVAGVCAWSGGVDGMLRGLVAFALVFAAAHLLFARWTRSLGGLTGDTYGAVCEIGEVVALAALCIHSTYGR
jgi:adenosylcobinamide-GDP ribazoletransferase